MTTPSDHTAALDAFMERYATICGHLERLQALADDHFGYDPDAIHWGHVGDIGRVGALLGEILAIVEHTR